MFLRYLFHFIPGVRTRCNKIKQLQETFYCSIYFIFIFTGSIARSATRRYLSYSEADFEVFRPFEDSLRAKFHPIGATITV